MLKNIRQLAIFILLVVIICFAGILLLTMPALFDHLNLTLSSKANIGSALGGITAPIVGVISSTLLYLALSRQTESNEQQRLKNESDVIFSLINQLDNELNGFYNKVNVVGQGDIKLTGLEGFNDFARNYRYVDNIEGLTDLTFKNYYESGQIILMIDTFQLIQKRIGLSNLSKDLKSLFKAKLESYYNCKLKIPLTSLSEAFDMYINQHDDYTRKIQDFVKKQLN